MRSKHQNGIVTGNGALTEQALRASELSYRRLFEAAKDGILILDVETGRISDVNPFLIDLLGFSRGEMVGKTVGELGPFKNNGSDKIMFERLQTDGYIRCDNLPLETRDGRKIAAELIGNVYQAGDKKMIQCHIRDITGHKRVEAVLRESEQRFEALFEGAREGVFQSTLGGQFRLANPALARMLGYASSQELIAGVTDIGRQLNVDTGVRAEFQRRITERGEVQDFEFQARRKDGATIWLSENAHAVRDANGAVLYYEGMLQDITERRRAEELLHHEQALMATLMENIPDGVYFKDTASRFLRVNSAQSRKFGLSDPAQIVGKSDADFFSGEHARQALADEQEIIRTGRPLLNVEEKETWPDGTVGRVLTTKLPLRDAAGRIIGTCGISRDITERKRAEEAVRESERRFQTLANTSPIGIFRTDAQGQTTYVNPQWCQITGLSATDALGDRWLRAVHPEDRGKLVQGWQAATQVHSTSKADYRFVHPDGTISWVMGQAVPEKDDAGRIVGYVGTITDITERKRAEEALHESEEKYRCLFDSSKDAFMTLVPPDWRFTSGNPATIAIFRARDEAEFVSKAPWELSPERQPDGRLSAEKAKAMIEQAMREGNHYFEWTHKRLDGEEFPAMVLLTRLELKGRMLLNACVRDITERKRVEEALTHERDLWRELLDNTPDHIYFKDTQSRFIKSSKALALQFGVESQDEMVGRTDFDFFTEAHTRPAYEDEQEIIRTGQPMIAKEEREVWKDGHVTWASSTKMPMRDDTGKIIGIMGISRDITKQRQLEEQFRQAQKMEAIGQLAGGVAHDFNNILGVIIGYGDLITEDLEPDSPLRKYAEEIRHAAVRATGLTRQLLVFSRKQKVELVVLDLNDTVKNMEKMLRRLIGENIEMTVVPGNEIGRIKADAGYIGQVLMNLAVNARDAMPNGGKLTIATDNVTLDENHTRTHKDTTPGDYVMLTVSDTGTGMTPEVKARIFEALFTTKPAGKGTGLGLATCQTIVQQSGGHIDVDSEVGKGTTFKIYFPRVDKPVEVTAGSDQTGPLPRGTETLLVVEDEPSVRHLAWKVLAALGYQVLRANNGQDALHLVHEHKGSPIRLVVTDVMMPVMGGKVMADWLKATYPDLKILFTSGYTDDAIAQQGVLEPGVAFLPKPYTPAVLARKVRAMLDNETDTAQLRKQGAAINQPSPGST